MAGGNLLESEPAAEDYVAQLKDLLPPMALSSLEEAASFVWAARALSISNGVAFDDSLDSFLSLVPKPSKPSGELISWLFHDATPTNLAQIARRNQRPDVPEGQEVVCFTTLTFAVPSMHEALDVLRDAEPDFSEEDRDVFVWTREYPKGHWSPFAGPGRRQILGSVRTRSGNLVGEAKTLTMACVLASKMRNMVPEVRIVGADWKDLIAIRQESRGRHSRSLSRRPPA